MPELKALVDSGAIPNVALATQSGMNNIGTGLQQLLQEKKNFYCFLLYTSTGVKGSTREARDLEPALGTPLNEAVEAILNRALDPDPAKNPLIQLFETAQIVNDGTPDKVYVNQNGGIAPDHDDMVKAIGDFRMCSLSLGEDFDKHIKVGANPIRIGNDLKDMFGDLLQLTKNIKEGKFLTPAMLECSIDQMSKLAKSSETFRRQYLVGVDDECIVGLRTFIDFMLANLDNAVDAYLAESPLTNMINGIQTTIRRIRD